MNKPAISDIIASAALAIARSARKTVGNRNQGVTIKTLNDLRKYANDPQLAQTVTNVLIRRGHLTEIPKVIFNLNNLEKIGLFGNQITEIPKEITKEVAVERIARCLNPPETARIKPKLH